MPFNEQITQDFKVDKPIVISGGDALELYVNMDELINLDEDAEYRYVYYTLTNKSDSAVNDISFTLLDSKLPGNAVEMCAKYPSGRTEYMYPENGEFNYANPDVYLPVFTFTGKDENVNLDELYARSLKPGETITGWVKVPNEIIHY